MLDTGLALPLLVRHLRNDQLGLLVDLKGRGPIQVGLVEFDHGVEEVPKALLCPEWDPFELLYSPEEELVSPHDGWLQRERFRLLDAYRNDPSLGLSNSRVDPQRHQVSAALRALDKSAPRLILADEVGLGKTIEAGLILKELRARSGGELGRVLIIVPASLITQWRFELRTKFNEHFVVHDAAGLARIRSEHPGENPWSVETNAICSLQLARLEQHAELVASAPWDLVIVDEAHHARRHWDEGEPRANDGYRLLDSLRDRIWGLLLLTATPMQLHDYELYSTIELVEPGLFRSYNDFVGAWSEIAAINRAVTILRGKSPDEAALREASAVLREHGAPPEAFGQLAELADRKRAGDWLSTRHRLSQALVRNRKAEIGNFTKRVAERLDVTPLEEEVTLERDLRAFIRARYQTAARSGDKGVGLVLVAFQKMFCSSSRALAGALDARAARLRQEAFVDGLVSDDLDTQDEAEILLALESDDSIEEAERLEALAGRARRIQDAKLDVLDELVTKILEDPSEKVLIFSQFLATIEMIRERLAQRWVVRVFHGKMSREEKDTAHRAFRHETQILISSEAGGEGRNFQFCHNIVNYDLPWNPMKIEQRIGRLDRVGQEHDVLIFNFSVKGMLDEKILNVLEHRIQIFTETVGALDPILESVEERISSIALAADEESRAAFEDFDAELDEEIRIARELDELRHDFILDWRSMQRERVDRLLGLRPRATRDDLERFCKLAIERFPSAVGGFEDDAERRVKIRVPGVVRRGRKEIDEEYEGTFHLHEALEDEGTQFFAFGHPLVEALLDCVGDPWWFPLSVLQSPMLESDDPALLVDYRLELYGMRNSGCIISHLVCEDGVTDAVEVTPPADSTLSIRVAPWDAALVGRLRSLSLDAARRVAIERFEQFKSDHAAVAEGEAERIARMFDSRRRFLDERVTRTFALVTRYEAGGTPNERRVIPALRGRMRHDQAQLDALETERASALAKLEDRMPTHLLRLLGAAIVVRPERLSEMALQ